MAVSQEKRIGSSDYSDDPIVNEEEDLLGRGEFADRFAVEIVSLPGTDSFVFALVARWGEGKTSVLNLVKRKLETRSDIIIVDFNPWYFANELGILEAFYGSIERALQSRFLLPSWKRQVRRYLKVLSLGLERKPFSLDFELPDNPERLRLELEEFLVRTGVRLAVFLDDIDRLNRHLALSALALTRLSARFRNTIFILSYDDGQLVKTGVDRAFLEKIVQKQIMLPPAEHRDLDEFFLYSVDKKSSAVDSLLKKMGLDADRLASFHEELDPFYAQHLRSEFLTLRDAKRFLNVLRPSLAPVINEVNVFDFFLLTVLQVFAPHVYKDIWQNREFYMPMDFGSGNYRARLFGAEKDARNDRIRAHIERVLENSAEPDDLKEILTSLFFAVATALDSTLGLSRQVPQGSAQRISDPICFPRYFLGRLPAGELSDGEVRSVIRRWNGAGDLAPSVVQTDLVEYASRDKIQELSRRVAAFVADIDPNQARGIALGFTEFTEKTRWNSEEASPSSDALFSVISQTANRSRMGFFSVALELVQAGSIYFSAAFASWLFGTFASISENRAFLKEVAERVEARLEKYFVGEKRDIFNEFPDSFRTILYVWATAWMTRGRSEVVEKYVLETIERRPFHLGRFLVAFAKGHSVMPDWFLQISAVVSPQRLSVLIVRFENELQSEDEKSAAEVIKKAVAESGKP